MGGDANRVPIQLDSSANHRAQDAAQDAGANRSSCVRYSGPRWYAVTTKHGRTHSAMLSVEALGFRSFLPWVAWPLPKGAVHLRPMFGRYLFVRFDAELDPWGAINGLPCVERPTVLYTTDPYRPTPVPDRLIDRIYGCLGLPLDRARDRMNGKPVVHEPVRVLLDVGAKIRLEGGPIAGTGQVVATRRNGRLACVEIDGFSLPIWVPEDRLHLLEGPAEHG